MKKTAHNVPRIGLAMAKGEHLVAANEPTPPRKLELYRDRNWKYTPSNGTDIRKLFAKVRRDLKLPTPKK